jgi:hypothetical protein
MVMTQAADLPETGSGPKSQWVYFNSNSNLAYKTLERGDKIMDYSYAGYGGGGVMIPLVAVKKTVRPSGGDDTAAIQAAITEVSKISPVDGFRGAVLLEAGAFDCQGTLTISTSGVVLRGSGSGSNGTTIKMSGAPHVCISIAGSGSAQEVGGSAAITDAYVPSGATSFCVDNASGFAVGDTVRIRRPITDTWVQFMGMDQLVRDGKPQTWLSGVITTERRIQGLSSNQIALDLPLTDSFDARHLNPPGGLMVKCTFPGRISQVGVEHLHILSPAQAVGINQPQHQALRLNAVVDAWVRDLAIEDTVNSVQIGSAAKRITVDTVHIRHSVATVGSAKPADFTGSGSQILFNRCVVTGSNLFYFVTGARATGPIVLLNCAFYGNGWVQPHARWATGLLVDRCQVPHGGIDFMNRGEMGSGHGWTLGWGVAWNCVAKRFLIQQPPGSANWAIGCQGARETGAMPFNKEPRLPEGIYDAHGTPVVPASLYLAQLRERLGPQALKHLGY